MRVNTIVPIILRNASKDTTLPVGGGKDRLSPIFVKAGQRIFGNVATMHLREDIWGADAALWNPDRWASARPSAWEYIPFYGGARVCLGRKYFTILFCIENAYDHRTICAYRGRIYNSQDGANVLRID